MVNQISKYTIPSLNNGEKLQSVNIVLIELKENYNKNFLDVIFSAINQTIILVLQMDDNYTISAKYGNIVLINNFSKKGLIVLKGNSIDEIYDNLIIDLFVIEVCDGNSIEEQIRINEKINKLTQDIINLEIKRDKEVQFNKKVKYNKKINRIKKEIKEIKREI